MSPDYRLTLTDLHAAPEAALTIGGDDDVAAVFLRTGALLRRDAVEGAERAWLVRQSETWRAGPEGAVLWCWRLSSGAPSDWAAEGVSSRTLLAVSAPPAEDGRLILRCDSVAFPPGGCAYLHTHRGPGIRCLAEGRIRVDTEGTSTDYLPGGAWFESGPEPVFAQAADDAPTRFIRAMLLPPDLLGKSSLRYVREEDREKPKSQRYQIFLDEIVTLP